MNIIFCFYRKVLYISNSISITLCGILLLDDSWPIISGLFWTKIITNLLLGTYINVFDSEDFSFYLNLAYSKIKLLIGVFILDMLIWFTLTLFTIIIHEQYSRV